MMIDTEEMTMKTDTEEKERKKGELFDKKSKIENNSFITLPVLKEHVYH